MEPVIVIGAGLAGSEAAWQLAQRGIPPTTAGISGSWCAPTPCAPTSWRTRWGF